MPGSLRRQIASFVLLAVAGGAGAAPAALPPLPAFRVDPALLGQPATAPAVSASANTPAQSAQSGAVQSSASTAAQASALVPGGAKEQVLPAASGAAALAPARLVAGANTAAATPLSSSAASGKQPVYLAADRIEGTSSTETIATGNVDMQNGDRKLAADRLVYRDPLDEVEATGNVKLSGPGESITGPHMKLKLDDNTGTFDSPSYAIQGLKGGVASAATSATDQPRSVKNSDNGPPPASAPGTGTATRLDFEGKQKYHLADATYSTCPANGSDPDWFLRTSDISLDYGTSSGVAKNATIVFQGVPILYSPWMTFPLDNQRKSGLLPPTIGSTSKSGIEVTTPFYWNIAPDMDATIAPREMSKRGLQWNGEYRYLGESYSGQIGAEYLGDDQITHTNRDAQTFVHNQNFGYGFSGLINLNRVSDDTYFTDLSTRLSNITQTNLIREGKLDYNGGGWWSSSLMAQSFQTLQDPSQPPVTTPYNRLPQFLVKAERPDMPFGTDLIFVGENVSFVNPTGNLVKGTRTSLYPQLAYPIQTAAFYVTPKIGLHTINYQLEDQAPGVADNLSQAIPIFSVDSGTVFERPLQLFSKELTQTLEPRIYYLYVPKENQSDNPVFDSGVADYNFSQIFSENYYSGGDRVSNANQVTLAATSRIIDPENGDELLRGAIGQRYYFVDQTVTLPGVAPRNTSVADFLGTLSGKVTREVSIDTAVEYNQEQQIFNRLNLGARYQPEVGKVFNVEYRYTSDVVQQFDTSAQWPLFGGWHAVGRYNYSFNDKRAVETLGGLEYYAGCWALRMVAERLATSVNQVNNAVFIQLELNGFSELGSNPLNLLKRNVPGYGRIITPAADPVFASPQGSQVP